jgi:Tol biopolymer transport system component
MLVRNNANMPHWGADGMIYFSQTYTRGRATIARVPARGGAADTVAASDIELNDPSPLPDGRGVLVSSRRFGRGQNDKVSVLSLPDGRLHELADGIRPRYIAQGYLVYLGLNRRLLAAPFDARRLELTGPAVPVVDSGAAGPGVVFQHAVSANGALLYMTGVPSRRELMWVSRDGAAQRVDSAQRASGGYPSLSPDGSRVAFSRNGIWVKQLDRGPEVRISSGGGNYPAWTGDGRSLSYFSPDSAGYHLWLKPADGSAQETALVPQMNTIVESAWSRDGAWLVLRTAAGRMGGGDIYAMRPGFDTLPMPLLNTADSEMEPALSPDARFLAYASNQTGRYEIFVVPFPNAKSARWAVSRDGGTEPVWSPRGDELFYRDVAGNVVSVSVRTTPTFTPGASTVLFSAAEYDRYEGHRQYDVAPDGRRFLMVRQVRGGEQPSVVLVKGWLEAVRAKAAAPR